MEWNRAVAKNFADTLIKATNDPMQVWDTYKLGDGAVILNAGKNSDSLNCLGLFRNGQVLGYLETEESPKLATPLYGYYLNFEEIVNQEDNPLLGISVQPKQISQWLESYQIESAVLMPVEFPKFPFKIPTLKKVQIAIHEAFHVEVMLRYWFTKKGKWPAWDAQPSRSETRECYNLNEEISSTFREEQLTLSRLIDALIEDKKEQVCELGNSYLNQREKRYQQVKEVKVTRADETICDCKEAEVIMELEEGIADYASWAMLYDIGISSREELIQRYQASQNEPFYLTGAMLLHAIAIMSNDNIEAAIEKMVKAQTPLDGSLLALFKEKLSLYCR